MDLKPTLYQRDLNLDTNTENQLYTKRTQIFIHKFYNIRLLHSLLVSYQDTTTLYSYHITFYLRPLMPWYGKRGSASIYRCGCYGVVRNNYAKYPIIENYRLAIKLPPPPCKSSIVMSRCVTILA
jgi:hypothetical protein